MNKRILVIANETTEGSELYEAIRSRTRRDGKVLVIAPALNSRLRYWCSDEDRARQAAQARLGESLRRLAGAGIQADGRVGDADPLQATADALVSFTADEVIISTNPTRRPHWLARNLVERARTRFALPIVHVVADSVSGRDSVLDSRVALGRTLAAA